MKAGTGRKQFCDMLAGPQGPRDRSRFRRRRFRRGEPGEAIPQAAQDQNARRPWERSCGTRREAGAGRFSASFVTAGESARMSLSENYFAKTHSPVRSRNCGASRGDGERRFPRGLRPAWNRWKRFHPKPKGRRRTACPLAETRVLRRQAPATHCGDGESRRSMRKRAGKRFPPCIRRRQVQRHSIASSLLFTMRVAGSQNRAC